MSPLLEVERIQESIGDETLAGLNEYQLWLLYLGLGRFRLSGGLQDAMRVLQEQLHAYGRRAYDWVLP